MNAPAAKQIIPATTTTEALRVCMVLCINMTDKKACRHSRLSRHKRILLALPAVAGAAQSAAIGTLKHHHRVLQDFQLRDFESDDPLCRKRRGRAAPVEPGSHDATDVNRSPFLYVV